jgi:hypothetical protein
MKRLALTLVFLFVPVLPAIASGKQSVSIVVLDSSNGSQNLGTYRSGNASCSGASCSGTGLAVPIVVNSVDISAEIDGRPAALHCDTWHSGRCYGLRPGKYTGEVKKNSVWVQTYNFDGSKGKRVKYVIH